MSPVRRLPVLLLFVTVCLPSHSISHITAGLLWLWLCCAMLCCAVQKGVFTTVEGLLDKAIEGLASTQPLRRSLDPGGADAVEAFLDRLRALREGESFPFTVVLDDPSGNSFMENPHAPRPDPGLRVRHYVRNAAQNAELGLFGENARAGVDVSEAGSAGAGAEGGAATADTGDSGAAAGGAGRPIADAAAGRDASSSASGGGAGASAAADAAAGAGASAVSAAEDGDEDEDEDGEAPWGEGSALPAGAAADESGGGDETLRGSRAVTTMTPAVQAAAEAAAVAGGSAGALAGADGGGTGDGGDTHTGLGSGDGNVPGGWRKGGALIHGPTERAAATDRARTGGSGAAAGAGSASAKSIGGGAGLSGLLSSVAAAAASEDREVMSFPVDCPACSASGECCMFVTDVPHFKEVILMSSRCEECGWRDVEVKGGGAVPRCGTVTTLKYDPASPHAARDMSRDVIKGDTASIAIPELDLQVEGGSLGGMYTTVEGLLTLIRDKLAESDPVAMEATDSGGAVVTERREAMAAFMKRLDACVTGSTAFTLVIKDPMANSWVYSPYTSAEALPYALGSSADSGAAGAAAGGAGAGGAGGAGAASAPGSGSEAVDPFLTHEEYVRSEAEDIELGLTDMRVEGYGEEDADADAEGKDKDKDKVEPGTGVADASDGGAGASVAGSAAR